MEIHILGSDGDGFSGKMVREAELESLQIDFGNGYVFVGERPEFNFAKSAEAGHNVFEFMFPKTQEELNTSTM